MKATISAKELKIAIKTLKQINDCFQGRAGEVSYVLTKLDEKLALQSLGGVSASYVLGSDFEDFAGKIPIDAQLLSTLKFPEDELVLNALPGRLEATSGSLSANLAEPKVEAAEGKREIVPLKYTFNTKALGEALDFHTYGSHHNPMEAEKRLVRLYSKEGKIHLESFDRQVCAFNQITDSSEELEEDIFLFPKPVAVILDNLKEEQVRFGVGHQFWRLSTAKLDVSYPNAVKPVFRDFAPVLAEIAEKPSFKVTFAKEHIKKALSVLAPGIRAGKEENPKMALYPKAEGSIEVTLMSERIQSLNFSMLGEVEEDRLLLDKSSVDLNFRYTKEFVDRLSGDVVKFQYWKYKDTLAPLQGRAVSFYNDYGRYIIARISPVGV